MAYTKVTWVNGTTPAINATNLNHVEQGIYDATYPAYIDNATSPNNARIAMADLGAIISRNIADANTALIVNQVHASSTGKILDLQFGGVPKLYASITGKLTSVADTINLTTPKTPATAAAAGAVGDICWDVSYIYVCTATNTWERAAIATW